MPRCLVIPALLALTGRAFAQDCTWSDDFRVVQPNGFYVSNVVVWDPDGQMNAPPLLATVSIDYSQQLPTSEVNLWDGHTFLGACGTADDRAYAAAVFDEDGAGPLPPRLFVGGPFAHMNGADAPLLARWDGKSWSAVGNLSELVDWSFPYVSVDHALAIGAGVAGLSTPRLLVVVFQGGYEWGGSVTRLFAWDGTKWDELICPHGDIFKLAVADLDGPGPMPPNLYALSTAGGEDDRSYWVLRLDPSGWTPIYGGTCLYGNGDCGGISTIAVLDDDGPGPLPPALYVGGGFNSFEYKPANGLARWDGVAWKTFDEQFVGGEIAYMRTLDLDGPGPELPALYITGSFQWTSSTTAKSIVKYDGKAFSALGPGITLKWSYPAITSLAAFDDGAAGPGRLSLYTGGKFVAAGSSPAETLARWTGAAWAPLGNGLNNEVHAVTEFDDGSGPRLYAGGQFIVAGGVPAVSIASWDGQKWSAVGAGCNNHVDALCIFDDGNGPALYAGGKFTKAGGQAANYIAKWNGTAWSPLGTGLNGPVRALAVHKEKGANKPSLYAAGEFTMAGGKAAARIAKWNGAAWSALGSGLSGSANCLASAGEDFYVGGEFLLAGGKGVSHIARWAAGSWNSVDGGTNGDVFALAYSVTPPILYAAGAFTSVDGSPIEGVARLWQLYGGWTSLDGSIKGVGRTLYLSPDDGNGGPHGLFVGGDFVGKGYFEDGKNLMVWEGNDWSRTFSADAPVLALSSFDPDGPLGAPPLLAAAGQFTDIDGTQSLRLALLDCSGYCAADCDQSGSLDIDDFICFQTLFATNAPLADCDHDGDLTIDDFICFQTAFGLGCP